MHGHAWCKVCSELTKRRSLSLFIASRRRRRRLRRRPQRRQRRLPRTRVAGMIEWSSHKTRGEVDTRSTKQDAQKSLSRDPNSIVRACRGDSSSGDGACVLRSRGTQLRRRPSTPHGSCRRLRLSSSRASSILAVGVVRANKLRTRARNVRITCTPTF